MRKNEGLDRSRAQIIVKRLLVFLFLLFIPFTALAEEPFLSGPEVSVKAGQPFEITLRNAQVDRAIQWTWDNRLRCLTTSGPTISCVLDRPLLTEETLNVEVRAALDSLGWSGLTVVTIDRTGGRKPKVPTGPGGPEGPSKVGKLEKVNRLLKELQSGPLSEARVLEFYNKMGAEQLSMKDLIEFKDSVIKGKHKELGYYKHGVDFWNQNFRSLEMSIMSIRKEMVLKAWEATIKQYFRDHPESPQIYKMDVGGWVKETPDKMKFEGDIDFSIVMLRAEDAVVIRDIFEGEIKRIFNLDMVAVDALATAHRAATLSVYIGEYGADWAEKDAIRRGKMEVIEFRDGQIVKRSLEGESPEVRAEKARIFSILKNNEAMREGRPDMLAQIKQEKADPKPTYDMEPGISLEFLRHVTGDAIHQRLSPHEKLIRICKYLDRSAKEHAAIMAALGFKPEPINPDLIKAAAEIIEAKQDPKLNPEETYLKVLLIGDTIMGSAWLNDPEAFLQKLGQRATEVMRHNIEVALEQRQKKITGMKEGDEKEAERKKLLNELETEFKAFAEAQVEFPPKAKSMMIELATHFKNKGLAFKLSPEEKKRIAELLKRLTDNSKALRTWTAIIWQRVQTLHDRADTAIDEINNVLDVLDNHTIQKLRQTEGIEFERDGKKIKPMNIKAVNEYLNGTVLGTIGNNTAYKGVNLALEGKAYWEAVMNAETWSEGFKNLGYEVMTRRLPGYTLTEAFTMGNYGRMSLELAYLFCPLLAVPEGLYGMVSGATSEAANWTAGKFQQWQFEAMVDDLMKGAVFEKIGREYKVTKIQFKCPSGGDLELVTNEDILNLPAKCNGVYHIIIPEIKNHPVLLQFQEMLENTAVSSGRLGEFPYKYDTRGSAFGDKLYQLYLKKVDDVVLEYFKGVIEKIEKAKKWATGSGYADIIRIEREIGCSQPLVKYTTGMFGGEDLMGDAARFEKIVKEYDRLKKANETILEIARRWKSTVPETKEGKTSDGQPYIWGSDYFPDCSLSALSEKTKRAEGDSANFGKAVNEAVAAVEKIIGSDFCKKGIPGEEVFCRESTYGPAVRAKLCHTYYEAIRLTSLSEDCKKKYDAALQDLTKKGTVLKIGSITGNEPYCLGKEVRLAVKYDRDCKDCRTSWSVVGYDAEKINSTGPEGAVWIPKYSGEATIRLKVKEKPDSAEEVTAEKKVRVLTAEKCPKLKMVINADRTEIEETEEAVLTADPVPQDSPTQNIKDYQWSENEKVLSGSTARIHRLSGINRKGKDIKVGMRARTAEGYTDSVFKTITVKKVSTNVLNVSIKPEEKKTVKSGENPVFSADAVRRVDSGLFRYRWAVLINDQEVEKLENNKGREFTLQGLPSKEGDKIKIVVYVQDVDNDPRRRTYGGLLREGKAEKNLTVSPSGELSIELDNVPAIWPETETLRICVKSPVVKGGEDQGAYSYMWSWMEEGEKDWHLNQPTVCSAYAPRSMAGKKIKLKVAVKDLYNRAAERETALIAITDEIRKLEVSVEPAQATISDAETITITCSAKPLPDSGALTFNGVQQEEGVARVTLSPFSGKGHENIVPLPCTVTDRKGRTGEAVAQIFVTKKKLGTPTVKIISKTQGALQRGKPAIFGLEVTADEATKKSLQYEWKIDGKPVLGQMTMQFMPEKEGVYSLKVEAYAVTGDARVRVAGDETTVRVSAEGSETGKTPTGDELKKTAEVKYEWLKNAVPYLERLIELDDRAFRELGKTVRKEVLGGVASGKYGPPPAPAECAGKSPEQMAERIAQIEKALPGYYKCGLFIEDVLTKEKRWGCTSEAMYQKLSNEMAILKICIEGRDAATYWEFKCLDGPVRQRWENSRMLKAKLAAVQDSKPYKYFQEYAAYNDYKGYLAEIEKAKKEFSLPDPIPSPAVLPWRYSSSCGGDFGGSEMSQLAVRLKARPEMKVYKPGEIIAIKANVQEGTAPYTYSWTGDHAGKGEEVTFSSRKGGGHKLSVEVKDKRGNRGSAEITLYIGAVAGTIEDLPDRITYGTWIYPRVKLPEGAGKADQFRIVWQSDKSLAFFDASTGHPRKNPLETSVRIDTMGPIKIWAEILKETGVRVYETVGETPQYTVRIIPPKFTVRFDPPKTKVGKEVKVTVETEPEKIADLINYEWHTPASSERKELQKNAGVISFIPKTTKTVKLLVSPKTTKAREFIGGAIEAEYAAEPYTVTVGKPRHVQSKPKIWKCDTQLGGASKCGLYEVEDQFAVFHNISMKAEVIPQPEETPRYRWTMTPQEGCRMHNETSPDLTIDCSNTGSYTATVTVRDKNDITLGAGSGSVGISITEEMLNNSKKKAEEAVKKDKDVKDLIAKSRKFWREKKVDEAVSSAEEAHKLNPQEAEGLMRETSKGCTQLGWNKVYARDFAEAVKFLEYALRLDSRNKEAGEKLEKAKKFAGLWPGVEQKGREFEGLMGQKKLFSAQKKMLEIQDLQQEMPGGMANPFSEKISKDLNAGIGEYNAFWQDATKKHSEYFSALDWEAMLKLAQEVQKRELSPSGEKEAAARAALAQTKLAEREQSWQFYLGVKARHEKGDVQGASSMLRDLKNKPQYFMASDARRRQILDLIAAVEKAQKIADAKGYAMNLFKAGEQLLRDYNYYEAAKQFAEGLRAMHSNGDTKDPDYEKYSKLYNECAAKDKRIKELRPGVQGAAMEEKSLPIETLQKALKEAEELVSLQPNNSDWAIYKSRLESKLKRIQDNKQAADRLWEEGKGYLDRNRPAEALAKFRESLRYGATPERQKYADELDATITRRKAQALKLRQEGEVLQNQKKLPNAIAKYRESLAIWPDPALEEHIRKLEAQAAAENEKKATADRLWREGTENLNQRRPSEALNRFKESLTYWSIDERTAYVRSLEGSRSQAEKLRKEGEALQNKGRLPEAVTKYRESLKPWPDAKLEEHIVRLENEIRKSEEKKACAKRNRDEGALLQQQGLLKEALAKFRASYDCRPTPEMESHIRSIETRIASQAKPPLATPGPQPTGPVTTPPPYQPQTPQPGFPPVATPSGGSQKGAVTVTVRNVSAQNVYIFPKGNSMGPENQFAPGESRKVTAVVSSQGWLEFCAGRNGKTITCAREGADPEDRGRTYTVTFDESNPFRQLMITAGLR